MALHLQMPTISICHYDWSKVGNTLVNNDTRWPKPGSSMGVVVITIGPRSVIHWLTMIHVGPSLVVAWGSLSLRLVHGW